MISISFSEIDDQTAHHIMQWERTRVELPIAFNPVTFDTADISSMDMVTYPAKTI